MPGPRLRPGPLTLVLAGLLTVSCALTPDDRFTDLARRHGLQMGVVEALGFRMRFFRTSGLPLGGRIDVFLEGDGKPWLRRTTIASDPTSWQAVGLHLMLASPAPAVYLARPCYHALQGPPSCTPALWTHRRYAEVVVAAMANGLRQLLAAQPPHTRVRLIGFSGGGVLAMLLAERLTQVTDVVTIAANLDLAAWVRLHGYSALSGSLDPAKRPSLSRHIRQVHLAGGKDSNVPPALILGAVAHQAHAEIYVMEGLDHDCCWDRVWPRLRQVLDSTGDLCANWARRNGDPACRTLRSDD